MDEQNKINIHERLAALEVEIRNCKIGIDDIKDNHLISIYNKLDAQKNWLIGVLTAVVITLIGVVISIFK